MCASVNFAKVTHCIFTFDGILMDTNPVFAAIMTELLSEYDIKYTEDVHKKLVCLNEDSLAKAAVNELHLPLTIEKFLDKFERISRDKYRKGKLQRGVDALIRHLSHKKVPIAIATYSRKEFLDLKCAYKRNFFDLFDKTVCGLSDDEVQNAKPAPNIYHVMVSRFRKPPKPENCLVFESCPAGVAAALAAGMQVVYKPMVVTKDEKNPIMATKIISSIDDFKPEEFGLPPFPNCNC